MVPFLKGAYSVGIIKRTIFWTQRHLVAILCIKLSCFSLYRTRATVNLWVYEPTQLIKLVVAMPPMQVVKEQKYIVKALKNVTQDIVVLDAIK